MKGRGSLTGLTNNKWSALQSDMVKENIGLMALQETHLSDEHIEILKRLHGNSLEIFNSNDPENPTGKGGVAFVLNRHKTNIKDVKTYEVIKGRALLLQYTWHNNKILTVLAIYAPNDVTENKEFWDELLRKWRELRLPRLDILLGDFNMVEDAIDRLPCHTRDTRAAEALQAFRHEFDMIDGWRDINGDSKAYSFAQLTEDASHSRIDRIYATAKIVQNSTKWGIVNSTVPTDHKRVQAAIFDPEEADIGTGRYEIVTPQVCGNPRLPSYSLMGHNSGAFEFENISISWALKLASYTTLYDVE